MALGSHKSVQSLQDCERAHGRREIRSLVSLEEGHEPLEVFANSSEPKFGSALGPLKKDNEE